MYIVWAILGILCILWDMYSKRSIKLIFACSFLFCAIIAYKCPDKIIYQFLSLIIIFPSCLLLINKILKNEDKEFEKLQKLENCEGKTAIVTKDIGKTISIDGIGFVNYNNELYQAKSINDKEIKAGQKVKIVSRENIILNVEVLD